MTDGVDAAVELVQPPASQATLDLISAVAEGQQLVSGNHTVLSCRRFGDQQITCLSFYLHIPLNLKRMGCGAEVGAARRTGGACRVAKR